MIIYDFDFGRAGGRPYEADTKLVVDTDTVLTLAAPLKCLKAVSRWDTEIVEMAGDLQLPQLAAGDRFNLNEPSHADALRQRFRLRIPERKRS
jgi:hypothetical protein